MGSATKIFFATRILNFLHFLFILHSQSFQDVLTFLRNWVSTITLRKRRNIVRKGHSRRAFGSFNKDIYFALTQHHLRRRSSDKKIKQKHLFGTNVQLFADNLSEKLIDINQEKDKLFLFFLQNKQNNLILNNASFHGTHVSSNRVIPSQADCRIVLPSGSSGPITT